MFAVREKTIKWGLLHAFFIGIAILIRYYRPDFSYLNWNMFLALLALDAASLFAISRSKLVRLLVGLVWLVFYPNTFYMLTDLVHMSPWLGEVLQKEEPFFWFMLFVLAVLFGIHSGIESFQLVVQTLKIKVWYWRYLGMICLSSVSSLAIHIGRYARLNSWDLVVRPQLVIEELSKSLSMENLTFLLTFTLLQTMLLIFSDRSE